MSLPPKPMSAVDRAKRIRIAPRVLHQKNGMGETLLASLAPAESDAVAKALLSNLEGEELCFERSRFVNERNNVGRQPLHSAVLHKNSSLVKLLLSNGADVNERDEVDGSTPLHVAVNRNFVSGARMILQAKGFDLDLRVKDYSGRTAFRVATDRGFTIIRQLIIDEKKRRRHIAGSTAGRATQDSFLGTLRETEQDHDLGSAVRFNDDGQMFSPDSQQTPTLLAASPSRDGHGGGSLSVRAKFIAETILSLATTPTKTGL